MTRIRFHIGAHKTATTHLQMTLARCRLVAGTRYVPLKRLRRLLTSRVRKGRLILPWHRWYRGTWLFSDENILGTTANALEMYPQPASALAYFADCELTVFLCVRGYETFLPSAWGERLWHHPVRPFRPELPQRRWTDLVDDLKAALPGVAIRVWRYEDYRVHSEAIIRDYAGGAIERFSSSPGSRPKSGFSARAVEELGRYAGTKVGKRRLLSIRERFPVGENHPPFDPWSEEQKRVLAEMYADDLAALRERVELWQPGMPRHSFYESQNE
ncbi:hypothetical protein [Wenzhouxiangella sediminis]|uniref:Sulfotransferase family protein n=1 Tax=Wenzhouxiangella sediminis TaxID=1792836 RepID=A0A3E1K688_9GAMM|nr:hypothetical protein [Wenzhouxiangella sediminis]RFF29529.1 hypothetical protein DZC52_12900 [Wenzhouxiangella sediminis]